MSKGLAMVLIVLLLVGIAGYAMTPWLVTVLAPKMAGTLGLSQLNLVVGYPTLTHWQVKQLTASSDTFDVSAQDGELTYHWRELMHGQVAQLHFATGQVTLTATADAGEQTEPLDVESTFAALPPTRLSVEQLTLAVRIGKITWLFPDCLDYRRWGQGVSTSETFKRRNEMGVISHGGRGYCGTDQQVNWEA